MRCANLEVGFRKPVRITITVSHSTHLALADRSDEEGRSLSNLAAYILENALRD
jgi:CopG-like RHH_1 or ribbon-helix-helix domain, RHH_5